MGKQVQKILMGFFLMCQVACLQGPKASSANQNSDVISSGAQKGENQGEGIAITQVSPQRISLGESVMLSLQGQGFNNKTQVKVGDADCPVVELLSSEQLTCSFAGAQDFMALDVQVTKNNSSDQLTGALQINQRQLFLIGTYKGTGESSYPPRASITADILVNVPEGETEMVLFLSSYEPANWKMSGAVDRIKKVITRGYYYQVVEGVSSMIVEDYYYYNLAGTPDYQAGRYSEVQLPYYYSTSYPYQKGTREMTALIGMAQSLSGQYSQGPIVLDSEYGISHCDVSEGGVCEKRVQLSDEYAEPEDHDGLACLGEMPPEFETYSMDVDTETQEEVLSQANCTQGAPGNLFKVGLFDYGSCAGQDRNTCPRSSDPSFIEAIGLDWGSTTRGGVTRYHTDQCDSGVARCVVGALPSHKVCLIAQIYHVCE